MTPEQYQDALAQALMTFDQHPTRANLDAVYDAANAVQVHVGFLDPQVAAELTDLERYVEPQGLPAATVTAQAGFPWGWALAAGVAAYVLMGGRK
jgi:hypothetical protein